MSDVERIKLLLMTTCRYCGQLLLPEDEFFERKSSEAAIARARDYTFKECPHCGFVQPDIRFEEPMQVYEVVKREIGEGIIVEEETRLTPTMIKEWLGKISKTVKKSVSY